MEEKRKKNTGTMKEGLLNSLRESDTVEERDFNIQNITDQREVIEIIEYYEEIIKTGNKKQKDIRQYKDKCLKSLRVRKDLLKTLD